jgi:hypothetical protein
MMNTESPTPLNYATPVRGVYWRWPWWKRLAVVAVIAFVHLSWGLVLDIPINRILDTFLFPVFSLNEWLRVWPSMPMGWAIAVAVGGSLFVWVLLAALIELISRFFHSLKE